MYFSTLNITGNLSPSPQKNPHYIVGIDQYNLVLKAEVQGARNKTNYPSSGVLPHCRG